MNHATRQQFVIQSIDNKNEYWSNELGWVCRSRATVFTPKETHELNLPIGGQWKGVKR